METLNRGPVVGGARCRSRLLRRRHRFHPRVYRRPARIGSAYQRFPRSLLEEVFQRATVRD